VNVCCDKITYIFISKIKGVLFIKIEFIAYNNVGIIATRQVVTFSGIRAGRTFRQVSCEFAMFFCAFFGCFVECVMLVVC